VLGECNIFLLYLYALINYLHLAKTTSIARVGKTSLTMRFCRNSFNEGQESTVDAACQEQTVTVGE